MSRIHQSVTEARVSEESRNSLYFSTKQRGFCHACGVVQDGVLPNSRNLACSECGKHDVFGSSETLFMLGQNEMMGYA